MLSTCPKCLLIFHGSGTAAVNKTPNFMGAPYTLSKKDSRPAGARPGALVEPCIFCLFGPRAEDALRAEGAGGNRAKRTVRRSLLNDTMALCKLSAAMTPSMRREEIFMQKLTMDYLNGRATQKGRTSE